MGVLDIVVADRVVRIYGDDHRFSNGDAEDAMEVKVLDDVYHLVGGCGRRPDVTDIRFMLTLARRCGPAAT